MEKVIIIVVISGFHNTETDRLRSVIVISPSEVVKTHFIFHREGSVSSGGGGGGDRERNNTNFNFSTNVILCHRRV
jgi:hypothetical protein